MDLVHIGISVADLENSIRWYNEVFGFKEIKRFEKKELEIKGATLSNGEIIIEALMPYHLVEKPAMPLSLLKALQLQGLNHVAINVPDIKALFKKLKSLKVTLLTELLEDRLFFCYDPDGVLLEIKQK
jgi:methylmalonyl-CoA/ethylmalonyl-CoA epimerase